MTEEKGREAGQAWGGEGCAGGPQCRQQDVAFGRKGRPGRKRRMGTGEELCGQRRA